MICTRCDGLGFLNVEQLPDEVNARAEAIGAVPAILEWMAANVDHDVQVCDCCGDGESWYSEPGHHDSTQYGKNGPYAYNGGLPECW
jgi:hypothetical protein